MKLSDHQAEFLRDFALLILFCERIDLKVTAGELLRPKIVQKDYLKRGLTTVKRSYHQKKLAGDLNFFNADGYIGSLPIYERINIIKPVGKFWCSLNPRNVWGGNWKSLVDVDHFERKI